MNRGAGRPAIGGRNTRADIVDAARRLFAEVGFDRTTMRSVATQAGVDVALIYHHFASKDDLLVAALALPEGAESGLRPIPAGTENPGAAVASTVLHLWENDPTLREQALAMIRTALSHEHAAQLVRELHTTAILALVAEIVDERDPGAQGSFDWSTSHGTSAQPVPVQNRGHGEGRSGRSDRSGHARD